jgi:lysophospholipase L1-like esterase
MNPRFPSLLKTALALAFAFASRAIGLAAPDTASNFGDNVQLRGSLMNSRIRFEREKKGTVAFIGGSITEMNGYRPMVCDILKKRFPSTDFKFVDAGIGSTCSTAGAFRMASDVFAQGPVDLFFVEFAVNDDQDAAHTRTECIRGMEGIIRHARQINPNIDIVVTFFVNEGMLKTLQSGGTPLTIEAHETVAKHYAVSTINLAKEAAEEITAGKLTWQQYGGVHPAPYGNAIGARMIDELFSRAWVGPLAADAVIKAHASPAPIDPLSYSNGHFIDPKEARIKNGWVLETPDWKSLPGSKRPRFTSIPMLCATEPGAEASLSFEGTSIGAYVVAGPDAGILEASIDDGPARSVDLFHHFSAGLHYPRTVMLGTDLKPGKHILKLRVSQDTKNSGHAARIMQFGVN